MAIRGTHIVDDVQTLIYALLSELTGSGGSDPWTRWTVIRGYPESDIFDHLDEPFIYVETPIMTNLLQEQGGEPSYFWSLKIGAWDDRVTGGTEEINIIASRLIDFFNDPKTCHTQTFDVTLGTTTYTDTTLMAQGLRVVGITGPREMYTENLKEFRMEFDLSLRT